MLGVSLGGSAPPEPRSAELAALRAELESARGRNELLCMQLAEEQRRRHTAEQQQQPETASEDFRLGSLQGEFRAEQRRLSAQVSALRAELAALRTAPAGPRAVHRPRGLEPEQGELGSISRGEASDDSPAHSPISASAAAVAGERRKVLRDLLQLEGEMAAQLKAVQALQGGAPRHGGPARPAAADHSTDLVFAPGRGPVGPPPLLPGQQQQRMPGGGSSSGRSTPSGASSVAPAARRLCTPALHAQQAAGARQAEPQWQEVGRRPPQGEQGGAVWVPMRGGSSHGVGAGAAPQPADWGSPSPEPSFVDLEAGTLPGADAAPNPAPQGSLASSPPRSHSGHRAAEAQGRPEAAPASDRSAPPLARSPPAAAPPAAAAPPPAAPSAPAPAPDRPPAPGGLRTLHAACEAAREDAVRALLAAGAHCGERDADGWTPLHVAAQKDSVGCVRALLAAGAAAAARDCDGSTPLVVACLEGSLDAARALLDAGADPGAGDDDGATPLMVAAQAGRTGCVAELLRRGASPLAVDALRRTARDLAIAGGAGECAALLQDAERRWQGTQVPPHGPLPPQPGVAQLLGFL